MNFKGKTHQNAGKLLNCFHGFEMLLTILVFEFKIIIILLIAEIFGSECPFQVFESSILNDEPDSDYS